MNTQTQPSEMAVPQPLSARYQAVALTALVGVCTGLATWGLASFDPHAHPRWVVAHLVAPAFWFLLVVYYLWKNFTGSGRRRGFYHRDLLGHLGPFSRFHFVEKTQVESGAAALRRGFHLFGRRFFYAPIVPVADI